MEEGKAHQLWKKGELDAEDYFTLQNYGVPKVLTAISATELEIKGKITLRWITIELISYHIFVLHIDLKQDGNKVELMEKNVTLINTKDYSQLWRKGTPNIEGYFTLENYQSKTFMTAYRDKKNVDLVAKGLMSNLNYLVWSCIKKAFPFYSVLSFFLCR